MTPRETSAPDGATDGSDRSTSAPDGATVSGCVWLVGEHNPYQRRPRPEYDLYPFPENSAGGRLCRKVLGLDPDEYLARFKRVNLLYGPQKWSAPVARKAAANLSERIGPEAGVVLLGAKVCAAFSIPYEPFTVRAGTSFPSTKPRAVAVLPHPSGLCRLWNQPGAFEKARRAVAHVEFIAMKNTRGAA